MGCSLFFSPNICDRTAPTSVSEASTSTVKGFSWSVSYKIGAMVKGVFSRLNASSSSEFNFSLHAPFFNRVVKGAAMVLKL